MRGKSTQVPAALLVEDFALYPRHSVDASYVVDLARALTAGERLPPLVVEAATQRIVDGFHRRRAYLKAYGETATVPVVYRTYASSAELLADAIRLNTHHGRRLQRQDEIRCVLLAEQQGLPVARVAVLLAVPEARILELRPRVVLQQGTPEPAKLVAAHVLGEEITPEQATAMHRAAGTTFMRQVRSLHELIDAGLYDAGRADVCAALYELAQVILAKVPLPPAKDAEAS